MELVTMPQLGETVTEGTITRWWKQVGEAVAVDDVLFEVSTEKVDTEVPSAHAGFLRAILVAEGETVPVGTRLAVITETTDEDIAVEEPARVPDGREARDRTESGTDVSAGGRVLSPEAPPAPGPPALGGSSRAGPSLPAPPARPPVRSETSGTRLPAGAGARADDVYLSPVVRRLLDEYGLEPGQVVGSGRDGRITRSDVLAAAANRSGNGQAASARAVAATAAQTGTTSRPTAPPVEPLPDDEIVEFSRARRMTAENMVRSIATSVHTLVGTEVDYHTIEPARAAAGLSYLPFIARAVIDALSEYTHLNASVGEDALHVHRSVNLGVAVDLDHQALVVPVVHDAGAKRLPALAAEIAELAGRARAKRLSADDLSGGTFTITNVGRYGTVVTAPIINQPQVAILSTDGVRMRPVAVEAPSGEWVIAVHPVGNLSLTFDHRAVDGAYAAAFLARVRQLAETRDWQQEL
jgi:2-oxoglutarate dehydrogenase E2 component (dihydrolipoamide succinyltransferase)